MLTPPITGPSWYESLVWREAPSIPGAKTGMIFFLKYPTPQPGCFDFFFPPKMPNWHHNQVDMIFFLNAQHLRTRHNFNFFLLPKFHLKKFLKKIQVQNKMWFWGFPVTRSEEIFFINNFQNWLYGFHYVAENTEGWWKIRTFISGLVARFG